MRRFSFCLIAVIVLQIGLAAVGAVPTPTAGAACASPTKSLAGTVEGEDGRYVSSMVGIELFDAAGNRLGLDGCPQTGGALYTTTVLTNSTSACCLLLPGSGSVEPVYKGVELTKDWSVGGLPSNAATAWIEVYPKRCCPPVGTTNTDDTRYGRALRRPVPVSASSIDVDLPLRCGLSGGAVTGSTGRIIGRVYDNGIVIPSRVGAWTSDPDGEARPLGWGLHPDATGSYAVDPLAPGGYSVIATADGRSKHLYGVRVAPCRDTVFDIAVRGALPPAPEQPVRGDWDGNGVDEPGTFNKGVWRLFASTAAGETDVRTVTYGSSAGDVPVVGDWNGDGIDDIGVFRKGGTWHLRLLTTGVSMPLFAYGTTAGDRPVVGDWNGDGRDDVGIFRQGGTWHLRFMTTGSTFRVLAYGSQAGDVPVPGDWDGDGDSEPGIFRRGGVWHLRSSTSIAAVTWPTFVYGAQTGDVPVVGDWGGDVRSEPGIYRRGDWHLRSSPSSTGFTSIRLGFR